MIARIYHCEFVLVTVQGRKKHQPVELIEETEMTFTEEQHNQKTENKRGDKKEQKIRDLQMISFKHTDYYIPTKEETIQEKYLKRLDET